MDIRFYEDPETRLPHIYEHGVTEREVHEVLRTRGEDLPGSKNSRIKLGQTAMSQQKFPPGWDEQRVRDVLSHYEDQSEDEQFAEIEAAREAEGTILMAVPTELAPEIRALIARKQSN